MYAVCGCAAPLAACCVLKIPVWMYGKCGPAANLADSQLAHTFHTWPDQTCSSVCWPLTCVPCCPPLLPSPLVCPASPAGERRLLAVPVAGRGGAAVRQERGGEWGGQVAAGDWHVCLVWTREGGGGTVSCSRLGLLIVRGRIGARRAEPQSHTCRRRQWGRAGVCQL